MKANSFLWDSSVSSKDGKIFLNLKPTKLLLSWLLLKVVFSKSTWMKK